MSLRYSILVGFLLAIRLPAQTCINFPANFVPLASVAYVTAADANGDHLVVGSLAGSVNAFNGAVPVASAPNQMFCDSQVQLAPQQFFQGVYVPSALERAGNFPSFAGLLVDPSNNTPFPGGVIPSGRLGAVFAIRVGAAQPPATAHGWSGTGSMTEVREFHPAVLLPNGKVLVGGQDTLDLFDPSTGRFTQVGSRLNLFGPSATLLNDGRVLIVGDQSTSAAIAKLFDPATMQFTSTGPPVVARQNHTATLLRDGRVLITGGLAASILQSAEIFDPATGQFTATGTMNGPRYAHAATLLMDGRVLITGGLNRDPKSNPANPFNSPVSSAEIYSPDSGRFSAVGSMISVRSGHTATLLPNGAVLVGEGKADDLTFELFDPVSQRFSATGTPSSPHAAGTATLLPSGQVLIAGGCHSCSTSLVNSAAEIYNPATGSFSSAGNMNVARENHTAVLLFDGRVLVSGGYGPSGATAPPPPGFVAGGQMASAELFTPINQGLVTSQSGLTFRAAQGGAAATQIAAVLSNVDTIPFTVSVKTYAGGGWLQATASGRTAGPALGAIPLTITANPAGLAAQDYYGAVTLTPTDGKHSPVSIAVVLSIVPAGATAAPGVSPSGLVFLSTPGVAAKPQSFFITNFSSSALTVTGVATATPAFFDFAPKTASVKPGQALSITVTPASATLAAGVYRGSIKLTFGDNTTQSIDVLLVVSASASSNANQEATGCTATKLLPVITSIGAGFTAPVAWPSALLVQVVDDCGTVVNTGSVTASFTNGDSPISLLSIGGGMWSATWVPVRSTTGMAVRVDSQSSPLSGTVQVSGKTAANPKVPVVAAGGVLSSGDYVGSPALGLLVSIFGLSLADGSLGNSSIPLPQQLGSTSVMISGVQVPVLYVSDTQVNVLIPYELAMNAPHQLIVQRANAISVPTAIAVLDNQPAILATAGNGVGQGHIYKVDASGNSILADANSPAQAGDVLVIYAVGLGAVTPPVNSGQPAPSNPPSTVNATVTLTIGGQAARVDFAGLTPGFAGLYQVNSVVPGGVSPGSQVPVILGAGGRASASGIFMAVQ